MNFDNAILHGLNLGKTNADSGCKEFEGYVMAPKGATQFVVNCETPYHSCGYVYKCHYENDRVITENTEAIGRIAAAKDRLSHTNMNPSGASMNGSKLFTLAHISDVHADNVRWGNFRKFVDGVSMIDAAICTGDYVTLSLISNGTDEQYQGDWNAQFNRMYRESGTKEVLAVTGNHEKYGDGGTGHYVYTDEERYNALKLADIVDYTDELNVAGKMYYVKKYTSTFNWNTKLNNYTIWIVVLDEYDTSDYAGTVSYDVAKYECLSQAQVDWLVKVLQSAITNSANVIIAMHNPDQSRIPASNDSGFFQKYVYGDSVSTYDSNITSDNDDPKQATLVEDIIDAFKNGTSVKHTYTYAATSTSVSVDVTFASKGKFLCYLTGHRHKDLSGYSRIHPDQLYMNITCGCLNPSDRAYSNYGEGVSDLPRVAGTRTEDAFNVYCFDIDNKKVKVVRIGSDITGDMEERKCCVFEIK